LFLKEGFATWLGSLQCAEELVPERRFRQRFVAQFVTRALHSDSTRHTHAIIDEKAETLEQLDNTWDDICYEKGSAVVAMMAAAAGVEPFVEGIRRFLAKKDGVANREDLWQALDDGTGDLVDFARKWTTTKGFPIVKLEKTSKGYLLRQERFLKTGDLKEEEDQDVW
jgi:aminopeptidase 2